MTQREIKKLDKQIEQLYYKNASGLQINIMDIDKLFKTVRDSHTNGTDLEIAVKAAIDVYCRP